MSPKRCTVPSVAAGSRVERNLKGDAVMNRIGRYMHFLFCELYSSVSAAKPPHVNAATMIQIPVNRI